jgi:hypothetical protein
MEPDTDKIDEAVLALLSLGLHGGARAWKGFDWDSMDRLHQRGYIADPALQGEVGRLHRGRAGAGQGLPGEAVRQAGGRRVSPAQPLSGSRGHRAGGELEPARTSRRA